MQEHSSLKGKDAIFESLASASQSERSIVIEDYEVEDMLKLRPGVRVDRAKELRDILLAR